MQNKNLFIVLTILLLAFTILIVVLLIVNRPTQVVTVEGPVVETFLYEKSSTTNILKNPDNAFYIKSDGAEEVIIITYEIYKNNEPTGVDYTYKVNLSTSKSIVVPYVGSGFINSIKYDVA